MDNLSDWDASQLDLFLQEHLPQDEFRLWRDKQEAALKHADDNAKFAGDLTRHLALRTDKEELVSATTKVAAAAEQSADASERSATSSEKSATMAKWALLFAFVSFLAAAITALTNYLTAVR